VDAYKKAMLAASEEEEKQWKAVEKAVEQDILREKQRAAAMAKPRMPLPPLQSIPMMPQWPMAGPERMPQWPMAGLERTQFG